ncbi:phage tail tape-measure protein [Ensifer sp. KUDG1]|uniref:hypothetical protein n=1 Tax=Ensifer sp. KUDG1 TaxID=3373919 RepID=UPI003D1F60E2
MLESTIAFIKALAAFLTSVGINPAHLLAGLAGALVRAFIQGNRCWYEVVMGSIVGALCAIYLSPVIGGWIGLNMLDLATNNGLAFAIGMIGLSLAEGAVRLAQRWAANPRLPETLDAKGIADAVNPEDVDD